jgi:hypothetical protein
MRLFLEIFPSFCYKLIRNQIIQLLLHGNYVVAVLPTSFVLGRILWHDIVQFRCPGSGTTLKQDK